MNIVQMFLTIFAASLGLLGILICIAFHVGNKDKDFSKRWWQSDELKIAGLSILCFI